MASKLIPSESLTSPLDTGHLSTEDKTTIDHDDHGFNIAMECEGLASGTSFCHDTDPAAQ